MGTLCKIQAGRKIPFFSFFFFLFFSTHLVLLLLTANAPEIRIYCMAISVTLIKAVVTFWDKENNREEMRMIGLKIIVTIWSDKRVCNALMGT